MIESAIIFPIVLAVMIVMLSLGFLFYQEAMMQTVATELASELGASYKYYGQDIKDDSISMNAIKKVKKYRTSFYINSMKNKSKTRAEGYLGDRTKLTNLGMDSQDAVIDSIKIKADNVGRLHVEITISMETDILFGDVLRYFHIIDEKPKFQATGRAECMDITAYAGHVKFMNYMAEKAGSNALVENVGNVISDIRQIAETIFGW